MSNHQNVGLSEGEYRLLSSIKLSINRALLEEVIPSMRAVLIRWTPPNTDVRVDFFHDGEISPEIDSHYSAIMAEILGERWEYMDKILECDCHIVSLKYPASLPNAGYIGAVYIRKEPFLDP